MIEWEWEPNQYSRDLLSSKKENASLGNAILHFGIVYFKEADSGGLLLHDWLTWNQRELLPMHDWRIETQKHRFFFLLLSEKLTYFTKKDSNFYNTVSREAVLTRRCLILSLSKPSIK